jgi:hypothetical protein
VTPDKVPKATEESTGAVEKGGQALIRHAYRQDDGGPVAEGAENTGTDVAAIEIPDAGKGTVVRPSRTEKIAEDLRRDLEKLEQKRAEKEARKKGDQ